jgi:hypothetical protein
MSTTPLARLKSAIVDAADLDALGAWAVSPSLVSRPPGPLPGVSAGASPAYDLSVHPGEVRRLELWPPGSR